MFITESCVFTRRLMPPALALCLLSGPIHLAQAHETGTDSRWLVKHADLIFQGVVTNVQYRVSDVLVPKEDVPIPHTFVTFRVDRMWKGRPATQGAITLRFEGGLDAATDEVLAVQGVPRFDLGENVILFVRGNTKRVCPVVGRDRGRLRIAGGSVYNEFGQEVWLTNTNEFVLGASHPLPEAVNHSIDGTLFVLEGSPVLQSTWTPLAGWRRADTAGFDEAISQLVKELHTSQELAALPPVPSASINQKFVVKEAKAGAQ